MRLLAVLLLSLTLGLAACSGPREVGTADPTPPDEVEPAGPPAYETFDPAPYDAEPAEEPAGVEHDVPAELMEGTIVLEEPEGPRTVQGYRIQVFSSAEKSAADDVRDEVATWWRIAREDPGALDALPRDLPLEVVFNSPYYRVRVGAFEYRAEAETALPVLQRRFPEAFIVPDTVTIGGE